MPRPEVSYHRLNPRDKFLVLGSDGLWDLMTPMQVTDRVAKTSDWSRNV
jgi:pyruvate dehydrogenase phosphatase